MIARTVIAQAVADVLQAQLALAQPPEVIAAPPSTAPDYPAMAVWVEHCAHDITQSDEILEDANGNPLVGAAMDLTLLPTARAARLDSSTTLARVGTARCTGRIWCGARLPLKREELENRASAIFYQDDIAVGRLLVQVSQLRVLGYVLPWPWYFALHIMESEWTAEYAFAERLWSWIHFDLDVDMLVPRFAPVMQTAGLLFTTDMSAVNSPADIANLLNLERYAVAQDGTLTRE